ncbi:MAG: hypothetical protein M3Z25_18475 [Actinomycetota bacterium]|nr:hypothetical protein [Actinomycetota bacterium]
MISLFRRGYGASPLHLLALLASFGLAGYAVTRKPRPGPGVTGVCAVLYAIRIGRAAR